MPKKKPGWPPDQHGKLVIPGSVAIIETLTFLGQGVLTSVFISDSVKTIEKHAFLACKSLHTVVISDSVTTVEEGAFAECGLLSSATISKALSLKIKSEDVFGAQCTVTVVESVTLPNVATPPFDFEYQAILPDGKPQKLLTIKSDDPEFVSWNEQNLTLSTGGEAVPLDQVDKRLLIYCACQAPFNANADSSAGYGAKSLCDWQGRPWERQVVYMNEQELMYENSYIVAGIPHGGEMSKTGYAVYSAWFKKKSRWLSRVRSPPPSLSCLHTCHLCMIF